MSEDKLLNMIKEAVKREPHCIYIYYTGHSDEHGEEMLVRCHAASTLDEQLRRTP